MEPSKPTSADSPRPEDVELPPSPRGSSSETTPESDYQLYYGLASLPGIPFFYTNDTAEILGYSIFPPHPITLKGNYRLYYEMGCLPGLNLLHMETKSQSDIPAATLFPSRPIPQVYYAYHPSLSTEALAPRRPDPSPIQRPQTQQRKTSVPLSREEPQTQQSGEPVILVEEEIPASLRPGSIHTLASLSRTSLVRVLSPTTEDPSESTPLHQVVDGASLEDTPMPNDTEDPSESTPLHQVVDGATLEDTPMPNDNPVSDHQDGETGFLASIAGSFYKRRENNKRGKVTRFFASIAASLHGSREKKKLQKSAKRLSKIK